MQNSKYESPHASAVLLFDGVCNLCIGFIRFLLRRSRIEDLQFASLQSEYGQTLLMTFELGRPEMDSLVLVEGSQVFVQSDGALRVFRHLRFPWPFITLLHNIPRWFRDPAYRWVARNRYTWFGRQPICPLPTPEQQARFR